MGNTIIWLLLLASIARGQAILAPSGRTLFNKNLLIRSFTRLERLEISRDGATMNRAVYIQPLAVVYGIAPDWNVTAVLPYVVAESNGWADAQFFLKYDGLLKRNVPGGHDRLSAEFGVQAPARADRFSTGAFAYIGNAVFQTTRKQKFFTADVQYKAATRNDNGITTGNTTNADVAVAYFWLPRPEQARNPLSRLLSRMASQGLIGVLELNGEVQDRARTRTATLPNTGGGTMLLSPGVQYFLRRNLMLELSLPIPVVHELNGLQPKPLVGALIGFRLLL